MNDNKESIQSSVNLKEEFYRYLSFWPFFILSFLIISFLSFLFLRYTPNIYLSTAKIEILDKAQDSEMALPTAMTVFNRSMINLENEQGILNSFSLHYKTVSNLRSNIKFYTSGKIKDSENHIKEWNDLVNFEVKKDVDYNKFLGTYFIEFMTDSKMKIMYSENKKGNYELIFNSLSTRNKTHNFPFEIEFSKKVNQLNKIIKIIPITSSVNYFKDIVSVSENGKESDQLTISIEHPNSSIGEEYLNTLIEEFDSDGILDRQLEYKRTMEFVDSRSEILVSELNKVELRKQDFKEINQLTDISYDANVNMNQKFIYNSDIFKAESQKDLVSILKQSLVNEPSSLMPVNIGLENSTLNSMIIEFNKLINQMSKINITAGPNNLYLKNLDGQISDLSKNILTSIDNYEKSLEITIENLKQKESEYQQVYSSIPENEKVLRSIERELQVKESLFLLLLQKREEAAINFAVVKPSIKMIDFPRSLPQPIYPNSIGIVLSSIFFSFFIPFSFLFIKFSLDTKIHTKKQLVNFFPDIPVLGEIPYVIDSDLLENVLKSDSRNQILESFRMIVSNLGFTLFKNTSAKNKTILVTSSVKGEGKTFISSGISNVMSSSGKTLLIGSDLRNPQLHKHLHLDKNVAGLTDYIHKDNAKIEDYIIKNIKDCPYHVLLSGTIPPNPNELLASDKFKDLLSYLKTQYENIVIDSAPSLLVSDTFQISNYIDACLYVVRSNFTDIKLRSFIEENNTLNKLNNMNIILNGVGNSAAYGYKYGYQYGYQYGYKYGYNYGYGYGYGSDN